jgi:uncharacterized membrane protein YkoI
MQESRLIHKPNLVPIVILRNTILSALLFAPLVVVPAEVPKTAGDEHFESCLKAATARKPGRVVKVELKKERGQLLYEFDIRGPDARDWDIECDPDTATLTEIEEEVPTVQHPLFKAKAVIDEKAARAKALALYPGDVMEIEYEIEPDGAASYEFDISTKKGVEMKVEVDATTGKIAEANEEIWQVGYE